MITKYLIPIVALISFGGGSFFGTKILAPKPPKIEDIVAKIPACPPCNCPPAVEVDLQSFDLDKLNNKKGHFTYAPSLHNVQIRIDAEDSVLLKQMLRLAK